ncbi:MAG TPA: molybdopterin-dependent oxidoreductase [Pirellulaceae bacterium]|nr:molybdopterin-dependent oxidoreductase [Pirellulaceae bacterium]HMO91464.1 molybdopterin-dependent oxidoreductase [Pirellulaceae bacterium]HMP69459.1 molybdopterin-dependent oxidoreductase [Pirellulaceae bacterium]
MTIQVKALMEPRLPAGQQLIAPDKWPIIGERFEDQPDHDGSLELVGGTPSCVRWDLGEFQRLPQCEITTDIHCVTRWSKFDMHFSGVLLKDLLQQVDVAPEMRFVSFVANSARNHSTSLVLEQAIELETIIALNVNGNPIPAEHGGPIRVIVPGRYFYKSLKWLKRIDLLPQDRLGYWESETGYHNHADPWLEERYMAPQLSKREAAQLIESRNFSGRDLRSIEAAGRDLRRLVAVDAKLRNADFSQANLMEATFERAVLANANFRESNLRHANFRGADLEGANFCGADLRGADLSGASLFGATFGDDKSNVIEGFFDSTVYLPNNWRDTLAQAQVAWIDARLNSIR